MSAGKMVFVGVGPGDPELITLGAIRALEAADKIALPDAGSDSSAVEGIAGEWIKTKEILRLPMPMRGAHPDWQASHEAAADICFG